MNTIFIETKTEPSDTNVKVTDKALEKVSMTETDAYATLAATNPVTTNEDTVKSNENDGNGTANFPDDNSEMRTGTLKFDRSVESVTISGNVLNTNPTKFEKRSSTIATAILVTSQTIDPPLTTTATTSGETTASETRAAEAALANNESMLASLSHKDEKITIPSLKDSATDDVGTIDQSLATTDTIKVASQQTQVAAKTDDTVTSNADIEGTSKIEEAMVALDHHQGFVMASATLSAFTISSDGTSGPSADNTDDIKSPPTAAQSAQIAIDRPSTIEADTVSESMTMASMAFDNSAKKAVYSPSATNADNIEPSTETFIITYAAKNKTVNSRTTSKVPTDVPSPTAESIQMVSKAKVTTLPSLKIDMKRVSGSKITNSDEPITIANITFDEPPPIAEASVAVDNAASTITSLNNEFKAVSGLSTSEYATVLKATGTNASNSDANLTSCAKTKAAIFLPKQLPSVGPNDTVLESNATMLASTSPSKSGIEPLTFYTKTKPPISIDNAAKSDTFLATTDKARSTTASTEPIYDTTIIFNLKPFSSPTGATKITFNPSETEPNLLSSVINNETSQYEGNTNWKNDNSAPTTDNTSRPTNDGTNTAPKTAPVISSLHYAIKIPFSPSPTGAILVSTAIDDKATVKPKNETFASSTNTTKSTNDVANSTQKAAVVYVFHQEPIFSNTDATKTASTEPNLISTGIDINSSKLKVMRPSGAPVTAALITAAEGTAIEQNVEYAEEPTMNANQTPANYGPDTTTHSQTLTSGDVKKLPKLVDSNTTLSNTTSAVANDSIIEETTSNNSNSRATSGIIPTGIDVATKSYSAISIQNYTFATVVSKTTHPIETITASEANNKVTTIQKASIAPDTKGTITDDTTAESDQISNKNNSKTKLAEAASTTAPFILHSSLGILENLTPKYDTDKIAFNATAKTATLIEETELKNITVVNATISTPATSPPNHTATRGYYSTTVKIHIATIITDTVSLTNYPPRLSDIRTTRKSTPTRSNTTSEMPGNAATMNSATKGEDVVATTIAVNATTIAVNATTKRRNRPSTLYSLKHDYLSGKTTDQDDGTSKMPYNISAITDRTSFAPDAIIGTENFKASDKANTSDHSAPEGDDKSAKNFVKSSDQTSETTQTRTTPSLISSPPSHHYKFGYTESTNKTAKVESTAAGDENILLASNRPTNEASYPMKSTTTKVTGTTRGASKEPSLSTNDLVPVPADSDVTKNDETLSVFDVATAPSIFFPTIADIMTASSTTRISTSTVNTSATANISTSTIARVTSIVAATIADIDTPTANKSESVANDQSTSTERSTTATGRSTLEAETSTTTETSKQAAETSTSAADTNTTTGTSASTTERPNTTNDPPTFATSTSTSGTAIPMSTPTPTNNTSTWSSARVTPKASSRSTSASAASSSSARSSTIWKDLHPISGILLNTTTTSNPLGEAIQTATASTDNGAITPFSSDKSSLLCLLLSLTLGPLLLIV